MNWNRASALLGALFISLVCNQNSAIAQFRWFSVSVDQKPQAGGNTIYQMTSAYTGYNVSDVPATSATLTGPNGTSASGPSTTNYNDFPALSNALFGSWTITEHPASGPDNVWTINVAPFTLSDVFSATPVITNPAPGASVPQDFVVKWDPGGSTTNAGISPSHGPGISVPQASFGVDGYFSAGFHTTLLQPAPQPFYVAALVQTTRPNPTIVDRPAALSGQPMTRSLWFNSYSHEVQFNVVPEPCTLLLGLSSFIAIGACSLRIRR